MDRRHGLVGPWLWTGVLVFAAAVALALTGATRKSVLYPPRSGAMVRHRTWAVNVVGILCGLAARDGIVVCTRYVPPIVPPDPKERGLVGAEVVVLRLSDGRALWSAHIGDDELSAPLVTRSGDVFATARSRAGVSVLCLDGVRRSVRWHRQFRGWMATRPFQIGDRLVLYWEFASGHGTTRFHVLQQNNGRTVWEENAANGWPCVDDSGNVVFRARDGTIVSRGSVNGSVRWRRQLGGVSVPDFANGSVFVVVRGNRLAELASTDGHTVTTMPILPGALAVCAGPSGVVVAVRKGRMEGISVRAHKRLWARPASGLYKVCWGADGSLMVISGGRADVLDGKSGRVLWTHRCRNDLPGWDIAPDGSIVLGTDSGDVCAYR